MTRRERMEARAERRREWAESREKKSETAHRTAVTLMDGIPLGQPILVGHHSEKRHRRDIARIQSAAHEHVESAKMADRHESAADEIDRQLAKSVFSDDADAVERLTEQIADLEAERDRVKRFNASARKGTPDYASLTEAERNDLLVLARVAPYQLAKGGGFPSYKLSYLGTKIREKKQRIEQITRERAMADAGQRGHGRQMESRYGGTCPDCGEPFDRGDQILWFRVTREATHAVCPPKEEGA